MASASIVYYVVNRWNGKPSWERVGTDKREAERRDAAVKREIASGTYVAKQTGAVTVLMFAEGWFAARKRRGVDNERANWKNHVLTRCKWFAALRIDAVTPPLVARLVQELKQPFETPKGKPGKIGGKTVALIIGTARTMFGAAVFQQLIPSNPVALPPGTLQRKSTKPRGSYGGADVLAIVRNDKVRPDGRVFAAMAFYSGMREGEICGRRFRDIDRGASPLWSMDIRTQYNDQPLKTEQNEGEHPRRIPVHHELAALLDWWWCTGFRLVYLRRPDPTDFVVPNEKGKARTKSSGYKLWRSTVKQAGVGNISLHSTRHTFVTWAIRSGVPKDLVERMTHNAQGEIIDQYNHPAWAPFCAEIAKLSFDAPFDGLAKGAVSPEQSWLQRQDSNLGPGG